MVYAVKADVLKYVSETKLIQLTSEIDTVNDDVVNEALENASSQIDDHIGTVYNVPLTGTIPNRVKMACVHLALYWLYTRREDVLGDVPAPRQKAYDAQIKWLEKVADGKATLGIVPQTASENDAGRVEYSSNTRRFTRETLGGL